MLEIIAGQARGLKLASPEDSSIVRPTSIRARKAFFDSVGDLTGIVFADMFAGSGAMGFEAASRGAQKVYFFEDNPTIIGILSKNSNRMVHAGVTCEMQLNRCNIPEFSTSLLTQTPPHILFADPPYAKSMELLTAVCASPVFTEWAAETTVYWELPDRDYILPVPPKPWKIQEIKNYGSARFLVLKCEKDGENDDFF